MAIKDAVAGSEPDGVLDAAVQGDDHAIGKFDDALSQDISANHRDIVQRQLPGITTARAEIAAHQTNN